MGKPMISACGYHCDECGAFHLNIEGPEGQEVVAQAWKKYYDIDMAPERIICFGCREPRGDRELPAKECETRDCVARRGLDNCAECDDFICEALETKLKNVEETLNRYRNSVSDDERAKYFDPYDARATFEGLRKNKR